MRRWFIGSAATHYRVESGFEDRPELAGEATRMAALFASLGYEEVPGFGPGLGADAFLARFRGFLTGAERAAEDVVVVYHTGHGTLADGELLLPMADTTADVAFTALRAADLTGRVLSGAAVQRLLIILDACYAAAAGAALLGGGIDFVNRLKGLATAPQVAVVVAARPYERAGASEFSRAFAEAVGHRASGGHEPEFLALDGIVGIVNAATPQYQHARLFLTGEGVTEFLPNPRLDRWLRDLDLRTQALRRLRADRRADERDHALPRARGLDSAEPAEDRWLFTGRHAALAEACGWLRSREPSALIVTGDPGSGKSALLARLFVLADARLRGRVPGLHTLPESTLPPAGGIDRFIHARGRTPDEVMAALCEACDVPATTSPGALLAAVRAAGRPRTVIIDAVDEAAGGQDHDGQGFFPLVDTVLAPLIAAAARTPLRLLLGTRRHLLPAFGRAALVLDLDLEQYADRPSISHYARACLVELADDSPYRHQPTALLDTVADAIAGAAGRSFLVALITARSLALRREFADPHDPAWRAALPTAADAAMRNDLDQRLGADAGRARDLLLPLAYSRGSGLPWEDLWPALASALSGRRYTDADIDWLIDTAGYYITEATTEGGRRSTYRLYHEALAEHLRADRADPADDASRITGLLAAHCPRRADGHPDWSRAHPYTRTHLATHAIGTLALDALLTDPRFLLSADPGPLLLALPAATGPDSRAAADAYRRAVPRLRNADAPLRPAYLQLAARCARAPRLADAIAAGDLPLAWSTDWASWRLRIPHHIATGHTASVNAVAVAQLEGRTVIVSAGSDRVVRIWDAASGAPIGKPLRGHADTVTSVAVGRLDGRTIIVSGGADRTVRIWDAGAGAPIGAPLTGHTKSVSSVAVGRLDGRTIIVSGGADHTVRIWDAATGAPIGGPLTGHAGPVWSVVLGRIGGRAVIVSGAEDARVRVWDASTGTPIGNPLAGHSKGVNAVALGQAGGRAIIVAGSDDDTVRRWDATTGAPIGGPLTGHINEVLAVAVGQLDGHSVIVSGSDDATVRVWDAVTGVQIGDPFTGHTTRVWSVAMGQVDGRAVLMSGSADRTVRIWDATTSAPVGDPFTGHTASVNAVAIAQERGRAVVISGSDDATVRIWDALVGTAVRSPLAGHTSWVQAVAVGQVGDRTVLVSGGADHTVRIWDAATGASLGDPLTGHTEPVSAVAIGRAGGRTLIVSGGADRTIRLWDATTRAQVGDPLTGRLGWVRSVALGQIDGRDIIVSGGDDNNVWLWDADTGIGTVIGGHAGSVLAVAIGRIDHRTVVVAGGADRTIRLWDVRTRTAIAGQLTGHTGSVRSIAIAHVDGRTVIVSGSDDKTTRRWDATTRTAIGDPLTGHTGAVLSVAVGRADGRTIVASGGIDRTVRVWDHATGAPLGNPFTGHTEQVWSLTAGQVDGRTFVASASYDRTVRLWDAATGTPIGDPLTKHAGAVHEVAAGQIEGRPVIASCTTLGMIQIWDAATRTQVGSWATGHAGQVRAVAVGRLGSRTIVVSGGDDRTVRLWNAATGTPIGKPLAGRLDQVRTVAIGPLGDRTIVASGGDDATVRLWDAATGAPLRRLLVRHHGTVWSVAVGDVGGHTVVVSGGDNETVRIWDAATGDPVGEPFNGHIKPVRAVAVGRLDGRTVIVSGGDDHMLHIRQATVDAAERPDDPLTLSISDVMSIDVSSEIRAVALCGGSQIAVATDAGIVSLRVPIR
ncbi:hypothetical protein [Dactylosporangium sp. CA-233914]|uniref:hypothetical protein n=1 Tax=Dactylosporangium sp. CA-233914 TaxID=3239934 RepID=UPI003D928029